MDLEKKVRTDTATLHYNMKRLQQLLSLIEIGQVDVEEVEEDLELAYQKLEQSKTILKKSLEEYFKYENNNPIHPKNFLFRKLYKTFF